MVSAQTVLDHLLALVTEASREAAPIAMMLMSAQHMDTIATAMQTALTRSHLLFAPARMVGPVTALTAKTSMSVPRILCALAMA